MRPVATDVTCSVVYHVSVCLCLSVSICVVHTDVLCRKNGWTVLDAFWGLTRVDLRPRNHVLDVSRDLFT